MKLESIKSQLQPYSIVKRRSTTINHAFASAIAPYEKYDPSLAASAIRDLRQDPEKDLKCVYCGKRAETWDHVYAVVAKKEYSGYGHTLGNLVPCCKGCNSHKGKKDWVKFLEDKIGSKAKLDKKIAELRPYFEKHPSKSIDLDQIEKLCPGEMKRLNSLKRNIITSMAKADKIAEQIRMKIEVHQ